ncbi:MAG: DUF554 domain-containing protein [Oscillospiraceae bacterium]
MLGVIVNTITVLIGSTVGLICKRAIPERITRAIMLAIGLCTVYIGISGSLEGENTLVLILSMVFGTAVGTAIDLDRRITQLGELVNQKFKRADGGVSLTEGFVTASLLFCVGAMTIVGSLNAGLRGDNKMLFTKSLLDLISSCMLSVSLGVGVMCAAAFVFVFQGALVLLAQFLAPILSAAAIAEITCAGSLMILALGLNLIGLTKLKVANFLPALIFAPLFTWLFSLLPFAV